MSLNPAKFADMSRDRSIAIAYMKFGVVRKFHWVVPSAVGARGHFGRVVTVRPRLDEMCRGIDAHTSIPLATSWPVAAVVDIGKSNPTVVAGSSRHHFSSSMSACSSPSARLMPSAISASVRVIPSSRKRPHSLSQALRFRFLSS